MIKKKLHIEIFTSNDEKVNLKNLDKIKKYGNDNYQIAIQDLDHQLQRHCLRDYELPWVYFSHKILFPNWENAAESFYFFDGNLSEIAENLYKYVNNGVQFDLTLDEWNKYGMDDDESNVDLEKIKDKFSLID